MVYIINIVRPKGGKMEVREGIKAMYRTSKKEVLTLERIDRAVKWLSRQAFPLSGSPREG